MRRNCFSIVCLGLALLSTPAFARHASPLEGQPAIRHRQELRNGRFEIGPSFSFSLNRFVRDAILAGVKLQYHLNDWLAVGADLGYGIGYSTKVYGELERQYSDTSAKVSAWKEKSDAFADIQFAGDIRVAATPLSGKLAIFGKGFMAYDFYGFVGFGFAMTKNKTDNASVDAANEGFRPGASLGLGARFFFTDFFSMGVEFRDLLFSDNESGGDLTRGLEPNEIAAKKAIIDGSDQKFQNHFFAGVNFTFYLPGKPKIAD